MSNSNPNVLLEVRDLQVAYGKSSALDGVCLQLAAGQIVTVIGPNGAGKSSMLNAIAGALPRAGKARGQVWFGGREIGSDAIEDRVAQGISLVPERRELFASMSVEDNLLLGSYPLYRKRHQGQRQFKDQMPLVYDLFPRLHERRKQLAGTMSGGERQMLALGRALMSKPQVLLLDEPSLGLAPLIVKEILQIVLRLKQTGVATLLVEQNARAALQTADYGYVLETGQLVLQGPATDLASNDKVLETYLGLHGNSEPTG